MTNVQPLERPKRTSRLLIIGISLVGFAGAIGLAGVALGTVSVAISVRRRIDRMEVPPSRLARRQFTQARAAMSAGADAWRRELAAQTVRSSNLGQANSPVREHARV
jgi:hypothetical protein